MATKKSVLVLDLIFILLIVVLPSRFEENVAVHKQVETSSNQDIKKWPASNAVDGDIKQDIKYCAHTLALDQLTAWWRVDLGQLMTIEIITIYYRAKFENRFAGYSIFVSNISDWNAGHLCFEDPSTSIEEVSNVVSHQCQYVARFVTIFNSRTNRPLYDHYSEWAVLELCEVQVFGCPAGNYGNGNCNQICPGDCFGGNCNAENGSCFYCFPGKYGDSCSKDCSKSCKEKICEKDSGICIDCIPRKQGNFCDQDCSRNCNDSMCYQQTGFCKGCIRGRFDDRCESLCSANCKDLTCLQDGGNCVGCIQGKRSLKCDEDCPSDCVSCMQDGGKCTECVQGKYSTNCELDCDDKCKDKLCTKDDGNCVECKNGYYGTDCNLECETNCKICQREIGNCTECMDGFHGGNCSLPCLNCGQCSKETGKCLTTCVSGYEGEFCQMKIILPPQDGSTGTTVGIVVGLFLLVAVVIIGVVFVIRRRRQNSSQEKDPFEDVGKRGGSLPSRHNSSYVPDERTYKNTEPVPKPDNVYINAGKVTKPVEANEEVYCNAASEGVPITDLTSLVKTKMSKKAKAFEDEYKSLPSGDLYDHKIGMMTENRSKNRFKATFPYDHSRVILEKLDKDPHSDYINANYIDGVTLPAEYVATQGPINKTIDDLWRMIWQLKSGKIIMLTNLQEGPKKKCEKYWPDEGHPMSTKHFSVALDRERVYAFYVIRDITLTEKKTKLARQIHQFHFTTWPDHGTPDPNELVVFHRRVKKYNTSLKGKMVVHCSAGIGRTGTFIALDALSKYGKEFGMVDILGYITTMRKDRINMVQTADQYIALHNILIEAFSMPDTLITKVEYHAELNRLSEDVAVKQTKLWQEFQLLQTMKPMCSKDDYKAALLPTNRNKNKDLNVLAVDQFRVYLTSSMSDRTDYINAVALQSFTSRSGFIITQNPLEDTIIDLLTMIMDNQCDTIVIIDDKDVKWLPEEGKDFSTGNFTLKHVGGSSNLANIDLIDVAISNKRHKYDAKLRVFQMSGWGRDKSDPPNSSALLQLLELVDSRRKSNEKKTTVVMCNDGYTQCGVFCCVSNAREQMKLDEEVDIFQIARQILVRRPECLGSFEQYRCCYSMIKAYLDTTDVYVN